MKFDTPATTNAIDQLKVISKPLNRIDGPLKTTGRAFYAYERHDVVPNQAYGYVVGAAIAKGRIRAMDIARAKSGSGCSPLSLRRMPTSWGRVNLTSQNYSAALRSSTITRRSRSSSQRRSIKHAPPQNWSGSTMIAPRAPSISLP